MSLTLEEFSDRELLFALEEHGDNLGSVSSRELAEGLGLRPTDDLKHPHQNVAIRLSWLRRYGVVHRDAETKRWSLTDVGYALMHTDLRAPERRLMADLDPNRLYAVMQEMTRSVVAAPDEAATMVSRHWRYSLAERKRNRGR